jgi:hypothetical protein
MGAAFGASAPPGGIGMTPAERFGELARGTVYGIAAGSAASAIGSGRVMARQVAVDAFGNALGNGLMAAGSDAQRESARREALFSLSQGSTGSTAPSLRVTEGARELWNTLADEAVGVSSDWRQAGAQGWPLLAGAGSMRIEAPVDGRPMVASARSAMSNLLTGTQTGVGWSVQAQRRAEELRMQGVAEFGAALEQTRSDPRIGEQMREFAQRQFDRGGLNQRNALAAYSAAYGAIVNGDPRDVQSSLAIGSAFNVLAGPGSRAGEAGTAMLLSQLAASDLPSDEVMRRVNAASSFVIDAKRDAARYGLEQAMLNRLDRVNLWNAPAMQAGSEVASIWGAAQVNGLSRSATLGQSRRVDDTDPGPIGSMGPGEARSLANAARLRGQLAGQEIAGGHAFEKHVLNQGEFKSLGIRTREQFAGHIENVLNNPTASRQLRDGRSAHWHESTGTVVIRNPRDTDGGTAFQPTGGRAYFDGLR